MTGPTASTPARFVVTGPTGWIGSALLALLHRAGDPDALGEGESVALFGSRAGMVQVTDGPALPIRPLMQIGAADVGGAHIVHLAYLTKDKLANMTEDEFRRANTEIDDAVIAAARESRPASIFVASSGAARQAADGLDDNAYGLTKLEQEARFLELARPSGVSVLCGRIFNLAGPYINKLGEYAVSNFAVQALEKRCIRIDTDKLMFRSFLHVEDLCRIVLRAARQQVSEGRPVDLCGMELLEIQDIAERVAGQIGGDIAVERPEVSFERVSDYVGRPVDCRALAASLDLRLKGFDAQLAETISWIRALRAQS